MDPAFFLDVLSLGLRWVHLIVGIAWIGSSFYFIWLDNSIRPPTDPKLKEKGVLGELWAMHAGGFYNPQKYAVAPKELPEKLHWFFWPSYSTFISGFFLICTVYYMQAGSYMVDAQKRELSSTAAILIGLTTLVGGWIVYDLLSRLLIERSQLLFAFAYGIFITIVAYTLDSLLSGRAAYLHVGAMMASSMTGNVYFIIIKAQKKIVAAMERGEAPDPKPGKRAKQRSIHNNYLALPVLFAMISNHYPFTYNHRHAPLVLVLIMISSVLIRHFFNLRHKEITNWSYPVAATTILLTLIFWMAPLAQNVSALPIPDRAVQTAEVHPIIQARCLGCHSATPTQLPTAAAGLMFDKPEQIVQYADRIKRQVVTTRAMPLGNVTKMTDQERGLVAAWVRTITP